ncbi:hypothetical protein QBC40DRAFT_332113 [Triangularia verruculosa]|uniref:C2H2-type domain-containing protein n=1 Tax=Triangularia verruculosa TaxID=2587418 RepID=A0AAN6XDC5_9PEZI|nr:hypothetical protein QBC40DRAFT_332113 [Triangularia verruculosa]
MANYGYHRPHRERDIDQAHMLDLPQSLTTAGDLELLSFDQQPPSVTGPTFPYYRQEPHRGRFPKNKEPGDSNRVSNALANRFQASDNYNHLLGPAASGFSSRTTGPSRRSSLPVLNSGCDLDRNHVRHDMVFVCDTTGCPQAMSGFRSRADLDCHNLYFHDIPIKSFSIYQCHLDACATNPKLWSIPQRLAQHLSMVHGLNAIQDLYPFLLCFVSPGFAFMPEGEWGDIEPAWDLGFFPPVNHLTYVADVSPTEIVDRAAITSHAIQVLKDENDRDACNSLTDSGYASAPRPAIHQPPNIVSAEEDAVDGPQATRNQDAMTIFSAATETAPDVAREHIEDVCSSIYRQIQGQALPENRESFSQALPGLVKGFAVRLGHLDPHQQSPRIMYFVYGRHREIAGMLYSFVYKVEDDDEFECIRANDPQEGMSLEDKMAMWCATEGDASEPDDDVVDQLQGLDDHKEDLDDPKEDLDELSTRIERSKHMQIILKSTAYEWLLQRLLRELSFHQGDAESRLVLMNVREIITESLPTGVISKRRRPTSYQVAFQLSWTPFRVRLELVKNSGHLEGETRGVLSHCIVFTSSANHEIQATTVEQYLVQTWASDGAEMMRVLSSVLGCVDSTEDQNLNNTPEDGTHLSAQLDSENDILFIHATGPACMVAELAEQLAWLTVAFQHLVEESEAIGTVYSQPVITKMKPFEGTENVWHLQHQNFYLTDQPSFMSATKWLEGGPYIHHVLAQGFPTACRPRFCPGVEFTPAMLVELFRISWTLEHASSGVLTLSGELVTLQLVKKSLGVYVWHLFDVGTNPDCGCRRYLCHQKEEGISAEFCNNADLATSRHIVGDCESTMAWFQTLPSTIQTQQKDAGPRAFDQLDSISSESQHQKTAALLTESPNTQVVLASSPEISIDSDMLSIPDTPSQDRQRFFEQHDYLWNIIETISNRLYEEFLSAASSTYGGAIRSYARSRPMKEESCCNDPKDGDIVTENPGSHMAASTHISNSSRKGNPAVPSLKRMWDDGQDDNNNSNGRKRPGNPGRVRIQGLGDSLKLLACPFWKLEPEKHRKCFKMELKNTSRVKQHLERKHHPDYYCERCKVVFLEQDDHHQHLTQVCTLVENATLNGITHQQHRQLSRRSDSDLSEEDKWFAMWDIVFPGKPRPSSAYVDRVLSEDICQFLEFQQRHGHLIAAEELRRSGILRNFSASDSDQGSEDSESGVTELVFQEAIERVFSLIHDAWLATRSSGSSQDLEPRLRSSRPRLPATPSSSFAGTSVTLVNSTPMLPASLSQKPKAPEGVQGEHIASVQQPGPLQKDVLAIPDGDSSALPDGKVATEARVHFAHGGNDTNMTEPDATAHPSTMSSFNAVQDGVRRDARNQSFGFDFDNQPFDFSLPIGAEFDLGPLNTENGWNGSNVGLADAQAQLNTPAVLYDVDMAFYNNFSDNNFEGSG